MVKWIAVFMVVLLAVGVNMPENMLARYGVNANFLTIALVAIALTGMIAFRRIGLVFVMMVCLVGANLPEAVATDLNINRDYLLATLIALVIIPFVQRHIED